MHRERRLNWQTWVDGQSSFGDRWALDHYTLPGSRADKSRLNSHCLWGQMVGNEYHVSISAESLQSGLSPFQNGRKYDTGASII